MKGQDHYVFIKENGKAQVVYDEGRWGYRAYKNCNTEI